MTRNQFESTGKLNPTAVNLWVFGMALDGALGGVHGACVGLAWGSGISLFTELVTGLITELRRK